MTGTALFSTLRTQSTPDFSVAEDYGLRNTTCLYSKDVASGYSDQNCDSATQKNAFSKVWTFLKKFLTCVSGLADFQDLSGLAVSGLKK
jgi:hypothetical protein